MTGDSFGAEIDRLGVTLDIEDDLVIERVLVVAIVRSEQYGRQIALGVDPQQDWIDQLALITAARDMLRGDL